MKKDFHNSLTKEMTQELIAELTQKAEEAKIAAKELKEKQQKEEDSKDKDSKVEESKAKQSIEEESKQQQQQPVIVQQSDNANRGATFMINTCQDSS